jgi:AcrR family transcriptional regulator
MEAIGAAAGMSGPGVYKHFPNKHALLAELYRQGISQALDAIERARAMDVSPRAQLEAFYSAAIEQALNDNNKTAIFHDEDGNLAPQDRAALGRMKRLLNKECGEALRAVRPELSQEEARFKARAVSALIVTGAEHFPRLDRTRRHELLLHMAMAALVTE